MVKFLTSTLYLSLEGNFISFFVGCPRIFSYPQIGYWVWPFLTQFVYMRLDIGPDLFQRSLNTGYNWSPQWSLEIFFFFFEKPNLRRAQSLEINNHLSHKIFKIQFSSTLKLYTKYDLMGWIINIQLI